ncbi:transposase [Desulfuribacillus stibiiarsenatis]|uniref:Transposase n=1 Tax=Desulfuribacillus stibiiarsenatis TaxID=1390249 RepID=A0A1E5L485_9FIRM|nr:alpha/beta hydrolase-fold protein [Desulfuribacillus stibiiarsenatis]OEH84906.1 transposase [Desulfuribacillus stibiiarsenatis]
MNVEYHKLYSHSLGQDMEFKVYGHAGKPVIVFPSSGGRFYEYEDFGMVEACKDFINAGAIQIFAVDSVDSQSWLNESIDPTQRAIRHNDYDVYITKEFVPYVRAKNSFAGKLLATGCSMGGYHSANFFFRHPDIFDTLIALSGVYKLNFAVGDYMDENVYFNSPLAYLPNLNDPHYLKQYSESCIVIAAGQGKWEEEILEDTYALKSILEAKNIFAWVDIWGYDVDHDWPWWRKMMPYFLNHSKLHCKTIL